MAPSLLPSSAMPRKSVPQQADFPYHVTGRCINRQWFDIPMPDVWDVFEAQLFFMYHAFGVTIHSFVLMNNHFHLIASTPRANLSDAMEFFMREASRELIRRAGRINHAWGGPFFRCMLSSHSYYLNTYKYVYRNPIKAGLARLCEAYPYSTLHGLLGQRKMIIPMPMDTLLFTPGLDLDHLKWLNTACADDEFEVGKALRKSTFAFRKESHYLVRPDDFVY